MSTPVILIEDLRKRFGEQAALDGLTLQVREGTIFGLVGPNGAGKTTAFRVLLGLTEPTAGRALVLGHDTFRERDRLVGAIGAVPETAALYPFLTARDTLRCFSTMAGQPLADGAIDRALQRVDLADHARKPVGAFSLGMRQRLSLAVALSTRPRVLLLDEPFNGLDPIGVRIIRQVIVELRNEGGTIVYSSHQLADVQALATDVAVMNKGRLMASGAVGDLIKPSSVLVTATPADRAERVLNERWRTRRAVSPSAIEVFCDAAEPALVVSHLVAAGISVQGVQQHERSLEELFFELIQPSPAAPPSSVEVSAPSRS